MPKQHPWLWSTADEDAQHVRGLIRAGLSPRAGGSLLLVADKPEPAAR